MPNFYLDSEISGLNFQGQVYNINATTLQPGQAFTYSAPGGTVTNYYYGVVIQNGNVVGFIAGINPTYAGDNYPTIYTPNGYFGGNYAASPSYSVNQSLGYNLVSQTPFVPCFLGGTLIATDAGDVPVEDLVEGDLVTTLVGDEIVLKAVVWVARGYVAPGNDVPDEIYPVRIRAGAFSDDLPRRDLVVTGDHCLLVDGWLIPARMLVNGGSIIVAREIAAYTYYHVELERHGILLAEGLAAESYLDTGNRGNFLNADVTNLQPDFTLNEAHQCWERDAAAPLVVDRETVEPIWRALRDRAEKLGMLTAVRSGNLTADPGLYVVTDSGKKIMPAMADSAGYAFALPAGVTSVRLCSRAARPADVVGPFLDDRRKLGVAVGQISLWVGRHQAVTIDSHLFENLRGWYAAEPEANCRWTNGNAELRLGGHLNQQPVVLRIEIAQAGPYLISEYMPEATAA